MIRFLFAAIFLPLTAVAHPHSYNYQSYSTYTNPVVVDNTGQWSMYSAAPAYSGVQVFDATGSSSSRSSDVTSENFQAFSQLFLQRVQGISDEARTALAEALLLGALPSNLSATVRGSISPIFNEARGFALFERMELARIALASRTSSSGYSNFTQSILDRGSSSSSASSAAQPENCTQPSVGKNSIFGPIPDTSFCGVFGPVPTHEELFYPNGR